MHGIIRGKTIELDQEAGVPEGQTVEVAIRPLPAGLDEDMETILRERKIAKFRGVPE
jgi:hypothetical protein